MDLVDVAVGVVPRLLSLEQAGGLDLGEDGADPDGRFHIAAFMDVVDVVAVVDDQHDGLAGGWRLLHGLARPGQPGGPQGDGIGLHRCHHHLHIGGWADGGIFFLQNGADDLAHLAPGGRGGEAEAVEDQIGRVAAARREGGFVGGAAERQGAVAFVEPEPRHILLADGGIGAEDGIVGQAFEIDTMCPKGECFLAHPVIEQGTNAAAGAAGGRRQQFQIAEMLLGEIQQKRHPGHLAGCLLGREQPGNELVFQWVVELVRQLVDVGGIHARELEFEDAPGLGDGRGIGRCHIVEDFADAQHQAATRWRTLGSLPMVLRPAAITMRAMRRS